MNPTQVGNTVKSLLITAGVSSSAIAWISDDVWVAVGLLVLSLGAAIWQWVQNKTKNLIVDLDKSPEVAGIVLHSTQLADSIPSPKVVSVAQAEDALTQKEKTQNESLKSIALPIKSRPARTRRKKSL